MTTTSKKAYTIISAQQLLAFNPTSVCNLPTGIYSLGVTINNYYNTQLPNANNGTIIYIFLNIDASYTWAQVVQEIQYKINLINNNTISAAIVNDNNKFVIKITSDIVGPTSKVIITNGCTTTTARTQIVQQLLQSLGASFKGDFLNALSTYLNYTISIINDIELITYNNTASSTTQKPYTIEIIPIEKIPQWKSPGALKKLEPTRNQIIKQIATAQKGLNKINIMLQNGDAALQKIKTYIQLLQTLEQSLNRGIYLFLNIIINYIQGIVDSIKSTGVYALDLTTYHIQPNIIAPIDNIEGLLDNDAWWLESDEKKIQLHDDLKKILQQIQNLLISLKNKYTSKNNSENQSEDQKHIIAQIDVYVSIITSLLNGTYPQNIKDLQNLIKWVYNNKYILFENVTKNNKNIIEIINALYHIFSYKLETYYEFIDVICNAFTDPYDVPSENVIKKFNKLYEKEKISSLNNKDTIIGNSLLPDKHVTYEPLPLDFFKSGKPEFPLGTNVKVVIWALATPNISEFITLYDKLKTLLLDAKNVITSIPSWKNPSQHLFEIHKDNIDPTTLSFGEEPNFYGITLNSLFPELFKSIDTFLEQCKSFSFTTNITSILESVNDYILYLQNIIIKIKELILVITNILRLVAEIIALLGALRELRIESKNGTAGILQQLCSVDPMTFLPPIVDIKMVLKKFGLNGHEPVYPNDSSLTITDYINESPLMKDKILKINEYAALVTNNITILQQQKQSVQSDSTIVSRCITFCNTLSSQLQTFLSLLDTSTEEPFITYRTIVHTYTTTLQNYTSTLQSLQTTYTNYINNVYSTTNINGYKNRKYIEAQIEYYTNELSENSGYNLAYYDEYNRLQNEIDILDANHSDPNAPSNPNYETERQALVDKQNDLILKKQIRDAEINGLLNTYTNAKNNITTFLNTITITQESDLELIENKISQLQNELQILKNENDIEHQNYTANKNAILTQIATNDQLIQDTYILINQKQQLINDKNTQIQNITTTQLEPALSDREALCPGCDCPLSRTELRPSPPCNLSNPTQRSQMLIIMGRILDAQEAIAVLQNEINTLNQEITTLNQEINTLTLNNEQLRSNLTALDTALQQYEAEHYLLELEKTLQINALLVWKLAEQTRLAINNITNTITTYTTTQQSLISTMYNNLLQQYVTVLYDPQNSDCINYIQNMFTINIYQSNNEQIVTITQKLQQLLHILQNDLKIIDNKILIFQNIITKLGDQKTRNEKINELLKLLNAKIFDPNEKMYYAGILFCWSLHPIDNIKNYNANYFNVTQAVAELRQQYNIINGQVQSLTGKDLKEIKNILSSIF